jgi:uncharacterized protein (TIGR02231 family)
MMRPNRTIAFAVLAFFSILSPLISQEIREVPPPRFGQIDPLAIQAVSRISTVTVFPDRATVVRTTQVRPVLGVQSVVFGGLPVGLLPNSLRVSGRGTAAVKILGLESAQEFQDAALLPEVEKLQSEIEGQTLLLAKLKGEAEVLDAQEKFVLSIQASTAAKAGDQIAQGKTDVPAWERVLDFLGARLGALKEKELDQRKRLEAAQIRLETLRKRLDAIKPQRPKESRKVTVLLEAPKAGDLALDLTYTVMNARWVPVYTLRALPETGEMELTASGLIQQRSGESWESVQARLSTSSPALESRPGALSSWTLDIYVPPPQAYRSAPKRADAASVGGVMAEAPAPAPPREAELETAAAVETGLHLNFEIKRPIDIPSDGAPHKVPIDAQRLKVKYDYTCTPKLKEMLFLRGTLKNTLPYPLLPGAADLFILDDYVGSTALGHVPVNDEAKLYFGEDRQIKVAYLETKREKVPAGFMGKTDRLKLAYRISLQNLRRTPVEIEVVDQLPVSRNSKIEVKDVALQPPAKADEKGILTWSLALAPAEKRDLTVEFTIESPKDARIIGL